MKIRILSAATLLLILVQTTISCNSCEDRNNDPIPPQPPEVGVSAEELNDGSGFEDASSTSISTSSPKIDSEADNTTQAPKTTSQIPTASSIKATSKPKRPAKSGYSAPNGTDAENHDGDPYTKHDTTSMPTGTSIR